MAVQSTSLNFAIVGAAKSGTSALSFAMEDHPEIRLIHPKDGHVFLSDGRGSPNFRGPNDDEFNQKVQRAALRFDQELSGVGPGEIVGDSSVFYIADAAALARLRRSMAPDGRVVAILRRPDHRAFSAYMHMRRDGWETLAFGEALAAEPQRISAGWQPIWWYRKLGYYGEQVERLFKMFGEEQVLVTTYDSLVERGEWEIQRILRFVGVKEHRSVRLVRNNMSGIPRSKTLDRFIHGDNFVKKFGRRIVPRRTWLALRGQLEVANMERFPIPKEEQLNLLSSYCEDIERLESLTRMDLGRWRRAEPIPL